jgi:hypothetical protein
VKRWLERAWIWFAIKPHRLYGTLYLLAIPVFADLYSWRSPEFYEPNLVTEAEVSHLRIRIEQKLCEPIGRFYAHVQKSGTTPQVETFKVSDLACRDSRITFATPFTFAPLPKSFSNSSFRPIWTLSVPALENNGSGMRRVSLSVEIIPTALVYALSNSHDIHPGEHYAWGDVRMAAFWPDEKSLHEFPELFPGFLVGYLDLQPNLYREIEEYSSACHGLPGEVRGGYGRFLYLSAVSITTLGFGDIIPVTTTARTLVAVEALVGIVLAGCFISSAMRDGDKQG